MNNQIKQKDYYDFQLQLEFGKRGEEAVINHLSKKEETVDIADLSEHKEFQALGIDAQWIYENPRTNVIYSTFFDVKTDFNVHKTDKLFIETISTDKNKGCMLTTKAEEFMYFDPILGKLYRVPIFPLREWYNKYGRSKEIKEVVNKNYISEGFLMSLEELRDLFCVEAEDMSPLEGIDLTEQ